MALYENVFIARQDLSPAQVESLADTYSTLIEESGGKVVKREQWGLKTLAFRIKKNRKGHYVMLDFEAEAPTMLEVERQMRLSEDVIRFLTVRVEGEVSDQPSPMMARRDRDRDDRRRREDRPRDDRDRPRDRDDRDRPRDRDDRDRPRDERPRERDERPRGEQNAEENS